MPEAAPQQFLIDIKSIVDELADTVEIDADLELAPLVLGLESFSPAGPAHVEATVTYTGAGQVIVHGRVVVDLNATCSRCLKDFVFRATGDVEGFYVRHGADKEIPEEQEFEYIDDRSIDILPAIRAALALDLPFAPLHDPECKGICPRCGVDFNESTCDCEPDVSDSPFAALKDLVDDADGDA